MIHLQIIGKENAQIKSLLRSAIQDGKIKSFAITQVKGGLRIQHAKYPGSINFTQKNNVLLATLKCQNTSREWQLLEALVGRLAYHFRDDMSAVNIQFD